MKDYKQAGNNRYFIKKEKNGETVIQIILQKHLKYLTLCAKYIKSTKNCLKLILFTPRSFHTVNKTKNKFIVMKPLH